MDQEFVQARPRHPGMVVSPKYLEIETEYIHYYCTHDKPFKTCRPSSRRLTVLALPSGGKVKVKLGDGYVYEADLTDLGLLPTPAGWHHRTYLTYLTKLQS